MIKVQLSLVATLLALIYAPSTSAESIFNSSFNSSDNAQVNGEDTKTWLEIQRSGSQASEHTQTLSGPVLHEVYDRYKTSFSHPIPKVTEENVRRFK